MSIERVMMSNCIHCGKATLESKTVLVPGTVHGEKYTVTMNGLKCPSCGYTTIEGADMPEFGRRLADEYRSRHGLLTSTEIRERRKQLGMSQLEFAEHLGVGVASVKRWEMGKIQDQRSNSIILEKTPGTVRLGRVYFPRTRIHGTTARGGWMELKSARTVTITGQPIHGTGIQHYIDGVVHAVGTSPNQRSTFSRLEVHSPTTLLPQIMSLLIREAEKENA